MYRSSDMGSSVPLNRACRREEHGVGPDFTVRPDTVSEFTVHSHSPRFGAARSPIGHLFTQDSETASQTQLQADVAAVCCIHRERISGSIGVFARIGAGPRSGSKSKKLAPSRTLTSRPTWLKAIRDLEFILTVQTRPSTESEETLHRQVLQSEWRRFALFDH